jgi:hypothetical protein
MILFKYGAILRSVMVLIVSWFLGGVIGYVAFLLTTKSFKFERYRLAVHVLRTLTLYSMLAEEKGVVEARRLIEEVEQVRRQRVQRGKREH